MSGDKDWSQALLIGGSIVAAGSILYYLYSSSSVSVSRLGRGSAAFATIL